MSCLGDVPARVAFVAFKNVPKVLWIVAGVAAADGGTVRIRDDAGPLRITVFSAPEPLRAGAADLSALVQRRDGDAPVLDAEVVFHLEDPTATASTEARATREAATNKLFYAAAVVLPVAGVWKLRVAVRAGGDSFDVAGELPVEAPLPRLRTLWPYLVLPPIAVLLFGVREWRQRSRATSR
jgi:hypothetical protein